jgi:hypothetical protein
LVWFEDGDDICIDGDDANTSAIVFDDVAAILPRICWICVPRRVVTCRVVQPYSRSVLSKLSKERNTCWGVVTIQKANIIQDDVCMYFYNRLTSIQIKPKTTLPEDSGGYR